MENKRCGLPEMLESLVEGGSLKRRGTIKLGAEMPPCHSHPLEQFWSRLVNEPGNGATPMSMTRISICHNFNTILCCSPHATGGTQGGGAGMM